MGSSQLPMARGNMPYIQISDVVLVRRRRRTTATLDNARADLQRQHAECRAERDEALDRRAVGHALLLDGGGLGRG